MYQVLQVNTVELTLYDHPFERPPLVYGQNLLSFIRIHVYFYSHPSYVVNGHHFELKFRVFTAIVSGCIPNYC